MDFASLTALLAEHRYLILFPLACIEGPMLGFVSGVLVASGFFNPFLVFAVLVAADVLPDIAYYFFGRYGHNKELVARYGPKIGVTPERFEVVRHLWFTHTFKTMLVTKFAYGLSTPLLISAGLVKLPFNRFWMSSTPLSLAQYAVLLSLGYFFAGSFSAVENTLVRVQLVIAAVVVLFVAYYLVTSAVRKKFLASQAHQDDIASS